MPRRKKAEEPEKENNERWLLTYSDMITLLLALFIMLFAISNVDAQKFKTFSIAFQKAFNPGAVKATASASLTSAQLAALQSGGLNIGEGSTPSSSSSEGGTGSDSGSGSGDGTDGKAALDEVYKELKKYVSENNLDQEITLINSETTVSVRLKGVLMFKPDEHVMLESSKPVLANIETAIAKVYDRVDHITISGHTADIGGHTIQTDQISWTLSTERAMAVEDYFVGKGLGGAKLSVEGCSDFHPVATNSTENGREQNRRVEITITKKPSVSSSTGSKTSSVTGSTASSSAASSKAASSAGTSQQAASK